MAQHYELSKERVVTELMASIKLAESKLDAGSMIRGWVEIAKIMGFYAPEAIDLTVSTKNDALRAELEAMSDD